VINSAQHLLALWVLLAISLGAINAKADGTGGNVSVKPAQTSAAATPLPTTTSNIGASARVTLNALSSALTAALPSSFEANGRQKVCADLNEVVEQQIQKKIGGDVGKWLSRAVRIVTQTISVNQLRHVCQDVDYTVSVSRTSPVTVSPAVNAVHVSTGVTISGQAGFSGDVAKALKLDRKNFRGGVEVFADLAFDVDQHWCPTITGAANFRWTDKAQLEIVHNVWLGIEGQVGDKIKDRLNAAIAELQSKLRCDDVTTAVSKAWHLYSIPLKVPALGASQLFLNFTPESAGFSGVSYEKDDLRFALAIGALTELTTVQATPPPQALALPSLKRIPASSDAIAITVPISLDYGALSDATKSFLKGRTFAANLPTGHVALTTDDVQIYPSNGQLALGVHFAAKTNHQFFDTKGVVYLLSTPQLDPTNQVVRFADVSFTTITDNAVWSSVATIFQSTIKSELEQKAVIDLKPKIADLRAQIQNQLGAAAAKQGIGLSLQQDFIGLQSVQLDDHAVTVVAVLKGAADLVVNEIPLDRLK
jgi:hypothetical protein